ncbi:MAG: hypothetical protein GC185_00935 [Alphaproteobacteria bacterium]|nr:hypothetical protein [Alphaproteobacteria bacterium]
MTDKGSSSPDDSPLAGYYLTRVYHGNAEPFAVVTDQQAATAVEFCSKFAPCRSVGDGSGGQEAYLDKRREVEDWLRQTARQEGIDIRKQNPVYFTLTKEPQDSTLNDGRKVLSIPAEQIDLSVFSFTVGDSMGNFLGPERDDHPLRLAVLTARQVEKIVEKEGVSSDYLKGGRYIEVQMWAPSPPMQQQPAFSAPAVSVAPKPRR